MCVAYNNGQMSTLPRMAATASPQDRARAFFGGIQSMGSALTDKVVGRFSSKPTTTTPTTGGMTGAFR